MGTPGPVVGDIDLDLVADPPDADADALVGRGVLGLVLEKLLEDLAEAGVVADRGHRPVGPVPADRMRAEQETERLHRLVDRLDGIERRTRQPGQSLAADRGEDRVHQPVEPAQLVVGGGAPVGGADRAALSAAAASARRST